MPIPSPLDKRACAWPTSEREFHTANGPINIKAKGSFRTDNGEALRDACVNGLGITVGSMWSVYQHLQQGELMQILKEYPLLCDTAIWAVYPSSRLLAPKVRAFIDYFREHFGSKPYWEQENDGEAFLCNFSVATLSLSKKAP